MIYQHLFDAVGTPKIVRAALIGAGDFGTAIVSQSRYIDRLRFDVVADLDEARARSALGRAGVPDDGMVLCGNRRDALAVLESGKRVVLTDADLAMDLPLDVVTTATRVPEAGARYAEGALKQGKHVVLVDKETDSVIAPILKKIADREGVVFTTDDGDEPGLLIGLVSWARTLGMEVICGGNIDHCLWDPDRWMIIKGSEGSGLKIVVPPEDRWAMEPIPPGQARKYIEARTRIMEKILPIKETGDPVSHMSLAVNGTGLLPDVSGVHRPLARITELPEILCPIGEGGILESRGTIEQPVILRTKDQPHGGGGIFIIVTHPDEYSRHIMAYKGLHHNAGKTAMLIYRPYHLCGAETAMSVLCAGLLRVPTGAKDVLPRVDITAEARRDFKKGEVIGGEKGTLAFGFDTDFRTLMTPGAATGDGLPIPYFMLYGNRWAKDVRKGQKITMDMVERPADSALWRLRSEQDRLFFPPGSGPGTAGSSGGTGRR